MRTVPGIEAQHNGMGLHLYGQQQPGMTNMAAGRFMGYPLCAASNLAPTTKLTRSRNSGFSSVTEVAHLYRVLHNSALLLDKATL